MNPALASAIAVAAAFWLPCASAEQVKNTMPACVSEELLSELMTYITKGDKDGYMQLLISGRCTLLQAGTQVNVISPGFIRATVRYKGVKMFTPAEALR
jgi:hypothetical protein